MPAPRLGPTPSGALFFNVMHKKRGSCHGGLDFARSVARCALAGVRRMNIGRIFASAIVRRLAYLLVAAVIAAVVSLFGVSDAYAQDYSGCTATNRDSGTCPDIGAARASADAVANHICQQDWGSQCGGLTGNVNHAMATDGRWYFESEYKVIPSDPRFPESMHWAANRFYDAGCPAPGEWRADLARCFDPSECSSRNGAENGFPATNRSHSFQSDCLDGCEYKQQQGDCTAWLSNPGAKMCSGIFQFSGESCSAPPVGDNGAGELAPAGDDSCQVLASGFKACKKPNGAECVEANGGAMICWGVGETGQKSAGSDAQTRGPGSQEPQPDLPTPPEEFDSTKKKGPETSQTTTKTPNGSTTTTTTTVINNTTTHGTTPPGEPGSAEGGEGDGEEGSASGGGDCETPPSSTGDPVFGMIALQTWETRCAVEKIGSVKVTGDIGDCDSAFSVEGPADDMNVQTMKAMRAETCPGGDAAAAGDGDAIDWSSLDGPDSAEGSGLFVTEEIGADGLDTEGLGFTRTCPTIPPIEFMGTTIQLDNSVMCDWLELGGQIMLILAALVSVRIMSGVGT